jgi:hypothetical protein
MRTNATSLVTPDGLPDAVRRTRPGRPDDPFARDPLASARDGLTIALVVRPACDALLLGDIAMARIDVDLEPASTIAFDSKRRVPVCSAHWGAIS